MEHIYRFKKRMVYPEKLNLDQIDRHHDPNKSSSWCSEPLDVDPFNSSSDQQKEEQQKNLLQNFNVANQQFIQDRIRHLVDAFTHRAQAVKDHIDTPATPLSLCSLDSEPVLYKNTNTNGNGDNNNDYDNSSFIDDNDKDDRQSSSNNDDDDNYNNLKNTLSCLSIREYSGYAIDQNGVKYMLWMSIAAIAVMYNAWVIPLRSAFPYQTPDNRYIWMSFDYLADFIYIIDMVFIQPRVKYLYDGFYVTDPLLLRQNYIKSKYFKYDLASLLPLDVFYLVFGTEFVILRLPRFLKIHTFWKFFNFIDKLLAKPYLIRVIRTLSYMMYLIHLNACAYYAFSLWEGIGINRFVFNGKGNAYIRCFYFATKTATSIGKNPKPTHEIEYMFMTISWLMGVFVFALLIGQIRDIISTATRSKTEYRKLVDETLEYMRRLNLPQDMQKRVQRWFNYTWETQHTLDENTIMDCLPHKMKTDIAINVHIQTLSKVKLFADCDEALLRELVLQLKSVIYLPDDIICKRGDVGKEMYIIQSGKVQVIGKNEVLATLSEGSVFGEISLLGISGMNRRTADVRSQGYSNLFVLSKIDLNAALSHYPEAQELLNKKAKILMKKNAAIERKHNAMIVIDNPIKEARLLDTVLRILPADSKSNRLLRYGSRGKPPTSSSSEYSKMTYRNSLPIKINNYHRSIDKTFETKVTVHRTLS